MRSALPFSRGHCTLRKGAPHTHFAFGKRIAPRWVAGLGFHAVFLSLPSVRLLAPEASEYKYEMILRANSIKASDSHQMPRFCSNFDSGVILLLFAAERLQWTRWLRRNLSLGISSGSGAMHGVTNIIRARDGHFTGRRRDRACRPRALFFRVDHMSIASTFSGT